MIFFSVNLAIACDPFGINVIIFLSNESLLFSGKFSKDVFFSSCGRSEQVVILFH